MTTIPPNPEEALVTISTPESDTVRVRDRVESSRFEIYFDGDVELTPSHDTDAHFPIDIAASCSWEGKTLTLPFLSLIHVYEPVTGATIAVCDESNPRVDLPETGSIIEVVTAPMKIYFVLEDGGQVIFDEGRISIQTRNLSEDVVLWSRSLHEKPSATITTPPTVRGVMDAVSRLGSALKTTSPERSWPTLRGYPPDISVGDQFRAPPSTERPDVNVHLEIPENLSSVFEIAPLAFYCAAAVVPSDSRDTAAMIVDDHRIPLDTDTLTQSASRLLQKIFTLDCVVRTNGFYPASVEGADEVLAALPWDADLLYDAPLEERLVAYSDVSPELLEYVRPEWPLTVDVSPTFDTVPALPHLAEELAIIRTPNPPTKNLLETPEYIDGFVRADGGQALDSRNVSDSSGNVDTDITAPEPWQSQLHTFLRDGYPLGSNKTSIRAYQRHLDRTAPESDTIEVHVVCNDEEMRDEEIVTEFYGVRDLLEFHVQSHTNLTVDETRQLLEQEFDLLHFIGHNDAEGLKCKDGYLDARTDIDHVGAKAFILNACRSLEQAEAIIDHGAHGGICTLYDVPNSSATRVGRSLSRLLNRGFNLRSALEIARETSVLGRRWISLGDGRLSLTQPESGIPLLVHIDKESQDRLHVKLESYETLTHRLGAITTPNTSWGGSSILPGRYEITVSRRELNEYLSLEVLPIKYDDSLYWSDEVSVDDLVKTDAN